MTCYPQKRWLAVLVFAALIPTSVVAQDPNREVLGNQAVIDMVAGKLSKDLILAKIRTTTAAFDLSAGGLVKLHENKVSEDIIKVMLAVMDTTKGAAPEVLTNQSVIQMVEGKLPKALILIRIKTAKNTFDLTAAGLVKLNQAKVPEDIIKVMMQPSDASTQTAPKEETKPSLFPTRADAKPAEPVIKHVLRAMPPVNRVPVEPGIYLYYAADASLKFEKIEPTGYAATRTDGSITSSLTKGISKTKFKVVVRGNQAAIQTSDPNVEFYFVFAKKGGSSASSNSWFADLTSPKEFSLVRFDTKASAREVVVAQSNALGTQSGTEDRANVPFTFDRLAAGVFRVAPTDQMSAGQYAFVSTTGELLAATGNRLFDFGVNKATKLPDK
jgi:hypothetical protein